MNIVWKSKNGKRTKWLVLACSMLLVLNFGCRPEDNDPLATALAFEKLSGNWNTPESGAVVIDGIDYTGNFKDFTISFTDGGYTTTNAGDLFRATGMWEWADPAAGSIVLDDGKEVSIIELTETAFSFTFQNSGSGGVVNGEESISGNYSINLGR